MDFRYCFIGCMALCAAFAGEDSLAQRQTLDSFPSLVSDHRAYRSGDTLTVLIFERASSTTSADRSSNKSLDVLGSLTKNADTESGGLSISNNSEGGASLNREGELVATVSVIVSAVLPNGQLVIEGEQLIEFNQEIQHIRLAGRVRPEDIGSNNTVLSTRIANAEISYVGEGLLGGRQKRGFITAFFDWLF
jgi:flagellar L-ring protein FlgH